jgi:MscS family membrane protein
LGINITALLAGAGVAGLAVAFAAQDTIANFFGSIMIILDRPFRVGDRIKTSGIDGAVESVGFRSTRVRTLDGHLVTVPNKGLATEMITNISERPYIKQTFNLTIVYDTPPERVERAIRILHELLDGQPCMKEDKPPLISFSSFNDWSLNILVIVWFVPADYAVFMEWCSVTNLEILRRFNAEGIEFAFPTNTTYIAGDSKRRLVFTNEESKVRDPLSPASPRETAG